MLRALPASGFLPLESVLRAATFILVSSSQKRHLQKFHHLLISLFAMMSECGGDHGWRENTSRVESHNPEKTDPLLRGSLT